jgi:hypothetical protein
MRLLTVFALLIWFVAPSMRADTVVRRDKSGKVFAVAFELKIVSATKDVGGNLVIRFAGIGDGTEVGFALLVPDKWRVHPMGTEQKPLYRCDASLVKLADSSDALDEVLRRQFRLKKEDTLFRVTGYDSFTTVARESFDKTRVEMSIVDPLPHEGEASWRCTVVLDFPRGSGSLTVYDQSG